MDRFVGLRVADYRRQRGLTQEQLAARVGVTRQYIAMIENGHRPVNQRNVLYALAAALQVRVEELTHERADRLTSLSTPALADIHDAVASLEQTLMGQGLDGRAVEPEPLATLVDGADEALRLHMASDYSAIGRLVPNLLGGLWQHSGDAADKAVNKVTVALSLAVQALGLHSLAWMAAQRAVEAGARSGDPTTRAAAAFATSQAMMLAGATPAAFTHADNAVNTLQPECTEGDALQLLGMLHLQSAFSASIIGRSDDTRTHYRQAQELAQRTGEGYAYSLRFGPDNVELWGMAIALEQHEGGRAVELSEAINPNRFDMPNRKSRYFVDSARGLYDKGEYESAFRALLEAEEAAPQSVQGSVQVSELAGALVRESRRKLAAGPLGAFAQRVGAVAEPTRP